MTAGVVTISLFNLIQTRCYGVVNNSAAEDCFYLDPDKLPKQINIDMPPAVAEHLRKVIAATGRSMDELIIEILDKGLQDYRS